MLTIKHIITPDSRELNILLPEDIVNKELEVIIFPVGNAKNNKKKGNYKS